MKTWRGPRAGSSQRPSRRRRTRLGLTLVEVSVAMVVVVTFMISTAYAFSGTLGGMHRARSLTDATAFLESVMENVAAQGYDNLLAMNGNVFFDGEDEDDSRYSATLTAFQAQVDLIQVRVRLTDLATGQIPATVTTLRSRR